MNRVKPCLYSIVAGLILATEPTTWAAPERPNVVFVLTDDQGYGDLGCHGNPILKTPHLDRMFAESVRFTDFHVSPLCTPTRGALLTGRDPGRNGAYRTSAGRSILHTDERTLANLFAANGYATGMFGKWHLGDNAPHRPQDYGFQDVVWHRCGGIGQVSDYWGNDYFDDTYERNGTLEQFEGYCTDIWFREGIRFIEENRDRPFFLYLPLNAPHTPIIVGEEWSQPYRDQVDREILADYYGMIANIDHNFGLLRQRLKARNLEDNTILIFMTDNGTYVGARFKNNDSEPLSGFNAGMRGRKASIFDGGHRVPFFIRWPDGGLDGGRDIDALSVHVDLFPTLAELCGIPVPTDRIIDGLSLAPLLRGEAKTLNRDPVVLQFHGGAAFPEDRLKQEFSYILTERWRLLHGRELYDMATDPAQRADVAAKHPEVVKALWSHYEPYWESVVTGMRPVRLDLGNPTENPVELCSQDWYMPQGNPPWNFRLIGKLPRVTAPWMVDVKQAGRYRFTLRQYPKLAEKKVQAVRAKIKIAGRSTACDVEPGSRGVVLEMDLPAGETELVTYLYDEKGEAGGAYFTEVEKLEAAAEPNNTSISYDPSVPPPTLSDIPYGHHGRQILDFWKAGTTNPTPLVFVIHGGGWRGGSKEIIHRFVDVQRLLQAGISVVAINYRLIRHAEAAGIEPPVMAPLHDAARALQFVRTMAGEWNIDKKRIAAAGGSAGACSSLWLAYHDDLADPESADLVARESTRLWCAAVTRPQTSLDPKQIKAWIPNCTYGGHAFGKESFEEFLDQRDHLQPWIAEYSPYALVSADDPAVYLFYSKPPALGRKREDPVHSSNFGVKLRERCVALGIDCEVQHPKAVGVAHRTPTDYLVKTLQTSAETGLEHRIGSTPSTE